MSIMTPSEIESVRKRHQENIREAHRIAEERRARERAEKEAQNKD